MAVFIFYVNRWKYWNTSYHHYGCKFSVVTLIFYVEWVKLKSVSKCICLLQDQLALLHELHEERYFDVFELNAADMLWACFLCNHPEKVSDLLHNGSPQITVCLIVFLAFIHLHYYQLHHHRFFLDQINQVMQTDAKGTFCPGQKWHAFLENNSPHERCRVSSNPNKTEGHGAPYPKLLLFVYYPTRTWRSQNGTPLVTELIPS